MIRAEANLLRLPLFALSTKGLRNLDGIECSGRIHRDGQTVQFRYAATRNTATLYPGPTSDQGGFVVNNNQPISFVHIESLSVSGGGTPVINGTNGNDVITIIARDSSYAAAADGVQDFTVSVNGGPNLLFVNSPSLKVNAQAGNNQVVLQAPAPNLAA